MLLVAAFTAQVHVIAPTEAVGDGVSVNRFGSSPSQVSLIGTLTGSATFGLAGGVTAASTSGIDVFFVTATLK